MEGCGEYYSHTLLIMEDDLDDTDETGDMIAETETAGATCITTAVTVSSAEPIPSPGSPLVDWCTCGLCRPMPQVIENKCCKQAKCITTTSLLQSYVWILMPWKCVSGAPVISEMIEKMQVHVPLGEQHTENLS